MLFHAFKLGCWFIKGWFYHCCRDLLISDPNAYLGSNGGVWSGHIPHSNSFVQHGRNGAGGDLANGGSFRIKDGVMLARDAPLQKLKTNQTFCYSIAFLLFQRQFVQSFMYAGIK